MVLPEGIPVSSRIYSHTRRSPARKETGFSQGGTIPQGIGYIRRDAGIFTVYFRRKR